MASVQWRVNYIGYTSYWSGSTKCKVITWAMVCHDLRRVIDDAGIPLGGSDGSGLPVINEHEICFNGQGDDDSHEAFHVGRNTVHSDFCKTERKPYDLIVCCALMILREYIPTLVVASDGDAEDWADAVALCRRVLEYGVYPCDGAVDTPEAVVHAHESPKTVQPVADVIEIHRARITEL